jgi:hypothetical protein
MIRLKNNTQAQSKIGYVVALDPKDRESFVYVPIGGQNAIGVVTESVPYRSYCNIATIGEKAEVYVSGSVVKGNVLRCPKNSDNRTVGSVVVSKSGDAPYLRVGEALASGRGFVPTIVDFKYMQSDGTFLTVGDISDIDTTYLRLNQTSQQTTTGTFKFPAIETPQITSNSSTPVDLSVITGTDKTLVLDTPVWDDSMVAPTAFRGGATALTFDLLTTSIYGHRWDVNDEVHIWIQFPHSIKTNTIVSPHIHIINKNAIGNTNYNVAFNFYWTWANINSSFPAEQSELNVKQSFQNIGALTHKMLVFGDITPTTGQGGISSLFLGMFKRVAADSQPYNTNDIFCGGIDIHFQKDTQGSRQRGSK